VVIVGLCLAASGLSGLWKVASDYGDYVDVLSSIFIGAFGVLLVLSSRTGKRLRSRT
jgi:hypothetical protein